MHVNGFALRVAFGLAAGVMVALLPGQTQNAVANGDTRTIHLYHAHTHESIDATYMVDGTYDQSVLDKLNWFLRDWRRDEPTKMDARLFDVIWDVYRESGSRQPIEVMSAYRSPETNAMLRRRSRGVAEHSQHILGKAMDQHYQDVPMSKIREIAMRLQRGGVGFYPTAGTPFVHMDVGGVRHWPRMSYDQLARLFPDGKTVHIPSNGQPLPGYEEARAELESRGDSSYPTASQIKSKGFFAWLFGSGDEDDDASEGGGGGRAATAPRGSRVASAAPVGGSPAAVYDSSSKDGGVHSFLASQQAQPAPSTPYGRVARDTAPPVVQAPAPSPQANVALAAAMAPARTEDGTAPAEAPPASPSVPDLAVSSQTLASNGLVVPVPPRRPTELADANDLPTPPIRPAELSPAIQGAAPTRTGRPDAIGAILNRAGNGAVEGSPTPLALAYAGPIGAARGSAISGGVPLPVARPPELVLARLDRGNFRNLTSVAKTDRVMSASPLGSAVGLRSAARAGASASATGSVLTAFGTGASELTSDRFSGSAVSAQQRVVTARRVEAGGRLRAAD